MLSPSASSSRPNLTTRPSRSSRRKRRLRMVRDKRATPAESPSESRTKMVQSRPCWLGCWWIPATSSVIFQIMGHNQWNIAVPSGCSPLTNHRIPGNLLVIIYIFLRFRILTIPAVCQSLSLPESYLLGEWGCQDTHQSQIQDEPSGPWVTRDNKWWMIKDGNTGEWQRDVHV